MNTAAAIIQNFPVSIRQEAESRASSRDDARSDRGDGIRAVGRAFMLLRLMNQRYASSLADLHRLSGLPKPTVCRILATLEHEGYVEHEGRNGIYRLASKVHELSAGYNEESQLIDRSTPILLEATRRIKWPLAIGALDGMTIAVRFSTMRQSPMAVQNTTLGNRHGLLKSAMGMTYLAFCPDGEREALLAIVARDPNGAFDRPRIEAKLEAIRTRGYGLRYPEKAGGSATAALPILHRGQIVAVLALTTFGSLMSERFVEQHRVELDTIVADISRALEQPCADANAQ